MLVDKRLIKYNHSSRNGYGVRYIVVHDTGNRRKGASALNHYHYFNGGNRLASAHYFVDDQGIVQTVEDYRSAWHCGDGRGRYGITNRNSIGIEMCVNEDSDFEVTKEKTLELIRFLLDVHGLPKDRVVRHWNASRKRCPASMAANDWQAWWRFWHRI